MQANLTNTIEQLNDLAIKGELFGEFIDCPNEVYHDPLCPGYSRSDLTVIYTKSFEHLVAKKQTRPEKSKPLEFGSAFHDLMQGLDFFLNRHYCIDHAPAIETPKFGRTKAEQAAKNDWIKNVYTPFETDVLNPWFAVHKDKTIWNKRDWDDLMGMGDAIKNHKTVQSLLSGAEFENTYFWKDPSGVLLKAKIDAVNKELGIIIDFKSTTDASLNAFKKSIANYFYDVQAASYLDAVKNTLEQKFFAFVFVVVEKSFPYGVALYALEQEAIDVGREITRQAIIKINNQKDGQVFGYPIEVQGISLPIYGFNLDNR
jgi:hypothetical protein